MCVENDLSNGDQPLCDRGGGEDGDVNVFTNPGDHDGVTQHEPDPGVLPSVIMSVMWVIERLPEDAVEAVTLPDKPVELPA